MSTNADSGGGAHAAYNPARDFARPPEIIISDSRRVACDGGGGALGHPRVYYDMGEDDFVECRYCDRRFVLRGSPADPERAASAGAQSR